MLSVFKDPEHCWFHRHKYAKKAFLTNIVFNITNLDDIAFYLFRACIIKVLGQRMSEKAENQEREAGISIVKPPVTFSMVYGGRGFQPPRIFLLASAFLLFRNSSGLIFVEVLKTRLKWDMLLNPTSKAISITRRSVSRNNRFVS